MRASPPLLRGGVERLVQMDAVLDAAYSTPEAGLGNKDDPLDEAIYIILSFQTDLARFSSTWARLRTEYPTWRALRRAPLHKIARVLREGGLQRQKARTIRRLLAEVELVAGKLSLDLLRTMGDEDAERLLTRLPGISWKTARCVLLYSLQRDVFPVDSNTFRILKRTGILSRRAVYRRRTLHDGLQAAVPADRRRALHVNLVVHGQRTCLPRAPQCPRCPLLATCPRAGLPVGADKHMRVFLATSAKSRAPVARRNAHR
jgi:endonuclease III